jgi:hypothetical protein
MTGDNPDYPPAIELVYPKAPRARRGTVSDKKRKLAAFKQAMATQKRTGRSMRSFMPLSASTEAYVTRKRDAARKRYAGRTDVIAKQMARAAMRGAKFAEASAKRAAKRDARALKRRRAAARGPIDELTMSPGTIQAILARRQKAGAAALARRMRDPDFAARYKRKMLGRRYRQGGRLLGADYKAPLEKRKTTRTQRVQGGIGLKKGLDDLFFMDRSLMRQGDYGSRASLIDYAQMMRDKAKEAYIRRKKRLGKVTRTPLTNDEKKERRRAYYAKKKKAKEAAKAASLMPRRIVDDSSPMSPVASVGDMSNTRNVMAMFSPDPLPSRPRVTRASAAAAAAKRASRRAIPPTNRRTRSMRAK